MFRKELSSLGIGHLLDVPEVGSAPCFGIPLRGIADLLFSQFGLPWHDLLQLKTVIENGNEQSCIGTITLNSLNVN